MDARLGAPSRQAGFSLLELVIAVAVFGVLAVGAALSAGRSVGGAERDADRFVRALEQNRALAVLAQAPRGLKVTQGGLTLFGVEGSNWRRGATLYDWRGTAALVSGVAAGPGEPDIVLRADGVLPSFTVTFRHRGAQWRCGRDDEGGVLCGAI